MPWNPFQELPIESNIPVPRDIIVPVVPWEKLEVGDSVFLPYEKYGITRKNAAKIASKANRSFSDKKFKSKHEVKNGEKGYRIWRVQ